MERSRGDEARFLIAASGSGGHLRPALCIADALKAEARERGCAVRIEFVGSGRPLERQLIDTAGYRRHQLNIVGVKGRGILGAVRAAILMPAAVMDVWRIISQFSPHVVIGVGGYVSVVPVAVAHLRGIPSWIHEAEIVPGLANSFLARMADHISLAFESSQIRGRGRVFTGHPIRAEVAAVVPRLKAPSVIRNILLLGGSQGAQALDDAGVELAPFFARCGFEIWHQTRPENVERVQSSYRGAGLTSAQVVGFIDDMPAAYQWSDIIVSRTGAGAVMELGVVNRPSILVPLPGSSGGHQHLNAATLVDAGKALIVEQGANFANRLREALERLSTQEAYQQMIDRPVLNRALTAAQSIARGCFALVG